MIIEKLVYGGAGLARLDGEVIFVEGALPGERVTIRDLERRGGAKFATVDTVVEASPDRRAPPCPYADECGGCNWQHVLYPAQVAAKRGIVEETLYRIGKFKTLPAIEVFTSPEFGYRIRCQLKIDHQKKALGFFKRASNSVLDISRCLVLTSKLNETLSALRETGKTASIKSDDLKLCAGTDGTVASWPVIPGLTHIETIILVGDKRFMVNGSGFFQGNGSLLMALGSWAAPYINGEYCVDLFGGAGFFSVMLGHKFERGILVEEDAQSVLCAQKNFVDNGLSTFIATKQRAETFFQTAPLKTAIDCCIIDPPRTGLSTLVRQGIARLGPKKILYISCNPTTQARDLQFLCVNHGYNLAQMALFDLYPQTHHIETGVVLVR